MTVEITKGTITQYLQGPKTGKFTTREGKVLTFKLDVVQDEGLRRELESGWLPDLEIPITVGLYRSPSGLLVTHITRQSVSSSQTLPAEAGPYRNAKEAYQAKNYKLAEEQFLEAIRKGDRQLSAIKDLASLLNERGRSQEAILLVNQFLMTKNVDKEEQAKLKKLRQNIHDAMPHSETPAASQTFREKIVGALAHTPPATPKPVPNFAPVPVETSMEFVCLTQDKHCFRLAPWRNDSSLLEIGWPTGPHFKFSEPWNVSLATFSVGPDRKPLSEGVGIGQRRLAGGWVLPLSLGEWQISLHPPVNLEADQVVYFRDDDILAGPWKVLPNGQLVAANHDYVYEWTWNQSWRRLEFKDRIYLLDLPAEREGNFYDFAGPEELSHWLEETLTGLGPEVAEQFEALTTLCKKSLSSPLDLSRWDRVQNRLSKIPLHLQAGPTEAESIGQTNGSKAEPPTLLDSTPALRLHLATSTCRCLLVPTPICSQDYAVALRDCEYFLITPSVSWLGLRDAWTELEWLWNMAHSRPGLKFLAHIEQANQTLLHHWAKPLINVAHGLSSCLLGFSDLGWPENLRVHWSLSMQADAFGVASSLRSAFGAVAAEEDFEKTSWEGLDPVWWSESQRLQNIEMQQDLRGEYARATALELGKLSSLLEKTTLPTTLARKIRIEYPLEYWTNLHDH